MGIHSPFADFVEVLCNVKERALLYQGRLNKSEASTRVTLIDPILFALGWDTSNPNMIEFEKTLPQSRADYALYDQENKIQVIIEAKALGINLGDKTFVFNLIMYALAAGIKDIFLTDGVIWEHYSDFTPGNVISSKTLDLTKDNLLDCAVYLVNELDAAIYWHGIPSAENGKFDLMSKQLLDLRSEISDLKQALAALQAPILTATPSPTEASVLPVVQKPEEQLQYVELHNLSENLTGKKPPVLIRFPDGSTKRISKWRDILVECVHYVLSKNSAIVIPLPDAAGKKVKLLDTEPLPEGIAQHKTSYNGKEIYIYANYDSRHCVTNALYILGISGQAKGNNGVAVVFDKI